MSKLNDKIGFDNLTYKTDKVAKKIFMILMMQQVFLKE